ncbi:translation initiation factor 6 [Methanohalophilus levihalophilus]|uniref:translation initiation factor IF-6 n=1 Tax=Methanohalophilus levihalophilus TaxID=1431282 RepID=UPI001AEB7DC5|nr:translation initiation factor IF-6 [Methanohalophilus levihalophilus]MBP2031229.1 translation initiation factor 6 [Methanohalophilus levihalophilus]
MIRTLNIYDNPVIGVFATCTENAAIVPYGTGENIVKSLNEYLDVDVFSTLISGSVVVGSLSCGNSSGLLVPRQSSLPGLIGSDIPIVEVPGNLTAMGNNILVNDSAALVNPELTDGAIEVISRALNVDVHRGTIAGVKTVGMAAVATNRGLLVHPRINQHELARLEDVFNLPIEVGTVNYGSQVVGSGVLANSKGYVAGSETTGHELGRIEDALMN